MANSGVEVTMARQGMLLAEVDSCLKAEAEE